MHPRHSLLNSFVQSRPLGVSHCAHRGHHRPAHFLYFCHVQIPRFVYMIGGTAAPAVTNYHLSFAGSGPQRRQRPSYKNVKMPSYDRRDAEWRRRLRPGLRAGYDVRNSGQLSRYHSSRASQILPAAHRVPR